MQLPPPVHGSALMNSIVANSHRVKKEFNIDVLETNYVKTTEEIGSIKIIKFVLLVKYLFVLFLKLVFKRPDLVYFSINIYGPPFLRDVLFVTLIKLFRVKMVYHLHAQGVKEHYTKYKILYDYAYNNVFVICLSENLKNDIPFYKGTPFVINNGIREISTSSQKIDNQFNDEITRILYVSNFIKSKGVLDLIEAAKILASKQLHFKIQLIGQYRGEITKDFLYEYISKYKLENLIEIVGPKFGKEKEVYFLNSDIFVFPTFKEAFGLVIIEAMQFGLPVISTLEGSIPEIIIDGTTGFLVKKCDVDELANKISILISNKDLRKQMGANGRLRFKKKFTETIFEENLVQVFKQILI